MPASRIVGQPGGLSLCGCAVAILVTGNAHDWTIWAAALLVGGLGLDAVLASASSRRSLISRIGPLP